MVTSWLQVAPCAAENGEEQAPWELRDLEGKGFAAFATRKFEKGDLILAERPTVWVHGHHPFDETQVAEIESKVAELDEADRRAFFEMANVFPEAPTAATGIFMTNCFDMTNAPQGESCAMYLAMARLNHSCTPNAQQTHLPETGEEVLYASRTIEIGEEINDCYIELRQSTSFRKKDLQEYYRFECTCEACTRSDVDDDKRRERARQIDDRVVEAVSEDGPEIALDLAKDVLRLLESEQCKKWSVRYLPDALSTVSQLASSIGDRRLSAKCAQMAYNESLLLCGPRSPETVRLNQRSGQL